MKLSRKKKHFVAQQIVTSVEALAIDDKRKEQLYSFFSLTMRESSPIPSLYVVEHQNVVVNWICGAVSIEVVFNETGACYMW